MNPVYNPSGLMNAANLLLDSLEWGETKEGYDYWDTVFNQLLGYSGHAAQLVRKQTAKQANLAQQATISKIELVHIFDKGSSLCGLKGEPKFWPTGNKWVKVADKAAATCHFCKSKAPV